MAEILTPPQPCFDRGESVRKAPLELLRTDKLFELLRSPLTAPQSDRVIDRKSLIFSRYVGKQQEFLDFVLEQYIKAGVGELDRAKLVQLLELKYYNVRDAITSGHGYANAELGSVRASI